MGQPRVPKTGATWHSHTIDHTVKKLSLLLILGLVDHLLHDDTYFAAMGTMTRSKITRGKTPTPYNKPLTMQRRSRQSSSPRLDINHLIGEINLPGERFDSILQVLHPRYFTPDDPEVNPEKSFQKIPPYLPTGVDSQAGAPGALDDTTPPQDNSTALAIQPLKSSRSVTISKTATTGTSEGSVPQGTAASPDILVRQSILLSLAKNATSTKDPEDNSGDTPTEDRP